MGAHHNTATIGVGIQPEACLVLFALEVLCCGSAA